MKIQLLQLVTGEMGILAPGVCEVAENIGRGLVGAGIAIDLEPKQKPQEPQKAELPPRQTTIIKRRRGAQANVANT